MTEALTLPHSEPEMKFPPPTRGAARPRSPVASSSERSKPVEIVAPDGHCADLLLKEAALVFPAEIVPGPEWIVRLQPPPGGEWALELLSIVERWLDSVPLPCAKVSYGGSSYLVRSSTGVVRPEATAKPLFATAIVRGLALRRRGASRDGDRQTSERAVAPELA